MCVTCLLIVAFVIISDSFAMCEVMVPVMALVVSSSDSLFLVRPANLLFCAYPPCADMIVPVGRRR